MQLVGLYPFLFSADMLPPTGEMHVVGKPQIFHIAPLILTAAEFTLMLENLNLSEFRK